MSKEERDKLGKVGMLPEEAEAKQVAKSERDLQRQIVQYLRQRNIECLVHRMDKRTGATIGWPDITFCLRPPAGIPIACAFEVKTDTGLLRKEQSDMLTRLQTSPNGWHVRVIRSLNEVIDFLREVGI